MEIAVIGASGAGLPFAAFLLKKHPDWRIHLFDSKEKAGKKVLATGNGHCNLLNAEAKPSSYSDPSFVESFLNRYSYYEIEKALFSLGIPLLRLGSLAYPKSFSASGYVETLLSQLKNNVIWHLNTKVVDYAKRQNKWFLRSNNGDFSFDKLVFACGGKSGKNLGSDGSLFPVFEKHGYHVGDLKPGLCPIRTKENVASLAGARHEAEVSLLKEGKPVCVESGEVLFKRDGLSGIVIFNVEREAVHRDALDLRLDLFPEESLEALSREIEGLLLACPHFGPAFLPAPLFDFALRAAHLNSLRNAADAPRFAQALKALDFRIDGFYDFEDSQVTIGGVSTSQVSPKNLESKIEDNVYFLGEVLDVDGPCGGYNLGWCLASALSLVESL